MRVFSRGVSGTASGPFLAQFRSHLEFIVKTVLAFVGPDSEFVKIVLAIIVFCPLFLSRG